MNERLKSFYDINQEMIFKLTSERTVNGMIYSPFDIIKLCNVKV